MNVTKLNEEFQGMDLSLLDQVLKGRFQPGSTVLDAGFGGGRNSFWFLKNGFEVYGVDQNEVAVGQFQNFAVKNGTDPDRFNVSKLAELTYETNRFDIIICNAVLHFAENYDHFEKMFGQLIRVLKPSGILFIRMTSDIGISSQLSNGNKGVYLLPDGSHRFLLTRDMLKNLVKKYNLEFVERLKTVNVDDIRCMSTLVLTTNKS